MEKQLNPTVLGNETVIERKAEQQKEYKLIGSVHIPRGMKYWKFNPETMELTEVERKPVLVADFKQKHSGVITQEGLDNHSKTSVDPKCIYLLAINKKNAIRKLLKLAELEKKYEINEEYESLNS